MRPVNTTIKLFGHPDSGHAYKVRLMLRTAGVEHTYEQVDIWLPRDQRSARFQAVARYGEVPVLLDGDEVYVQSNAILLHLAQRLGIAGAENEQRLRQCREWLVWEANKIGLCLPQLRSYHQFDPDPVLGQALPWLEMRYAHDVNVLEQTLADGRPWMVTGDSPTIADFSLCAYLFFADEAQVAVPEHVQRWLERISALRHWQHPYELMV